MSILHNAHALGIQAPIQGAWAWAHVLGMWDRAPYPSLYSWGVFGFFFSLLEDSFGFIFGIFFIHFIWMHQFTFFS